MANATLKVTTPVITGVAPTAASGTIASSETMTISATTAQGMLDLATLVVHVTNASSTASVSLSLGAGDFQDAGIGAATITVATATTVVIGGQFFESSRFLTDDDTIVFTQTGAGPTTWVAFQKPRASE